MNVAGNMGFALKLAKQDKGSIASRVGRAASRLGIGELLERRPKALSGGQRQRVALGRAIVRSPAAFLMDEPLSNLDAKLRVEMRAYIARLHQELGTTTLYVTHDQTEAMTMGDRVAVMRDGRLEQVDSPQRLYEQPQNMFVAGFIGSPAMNLLRGRVDDEGVWLGEQRLPLVTKYRGDVVVGIRPEALSVDPEGHLEMPVVLSEMLGSDVLLHLDAPSASALRPTCSTRARTWSTTAAASSPACRRTSGRPRASACACASTWTACTSSTPRPSRSSTAERWVRATGSAPPPAAGTSGRRRGPRARTRHRTRPGS